MFFFPHLFLFCYFHYFPFLFTFLFLSSPSPFFFVTLFPLLSSLPIFISRALIRPVRYQRQQSSAWLPRNYPWPNPVPCHAGTSSKPASRERWSSLCRSVTCSSACFPGLMVALDLGCGASPLPSDQTSPGRVCLFLGTLGVA